MNDHQFRAAFPLPAEPATLDAKIDRALAHHSSVQRTQRRVFFGTAVTAAIAFGFVALPAVQAQSMIVEMARSLDKQTHLKVITYSVDEGGHLWPNATTTILNGDLSSIDAVGKRQHFEVGSKSYDLDPTIGRFVVSERRRGGSIRLSDMLSGASGFSLGKRVDVQHVEVNGRQVLRATILNNGLPERYVIDADPKTELPLGMQVDSLERGAWKVRSALKFDYSAPLSAVAPDLKRFPETTKEAAEAQFESAMTAKTLAELPLARGRLVVRAFDVSRDGTVFVAYQSGDGRSRSWNGYALNVTDDQGSKYVHVGDILSGDRDFTDKEGAVQMEVFSPMKPVSPDRPRTLSLTANKWSNGRLARSIMMGVSYPDGHTDWHIGLNASGSKDVDARPFPLLTEREVLPTCGVMPEWANAMDATSFGNDDWADRIKAQYRAKQAMTDKDWPEAEKQLNEELRLIRDAESKGYGSYSRVEALKQLDKVHAAKHV